MKPILKYYLVLSIAIFTLTGCSKNNDDTVDPPTLPTEVEILKQVYPDHILGYENDKMIVTKYIYLDYDDKKEKSHIQLINNADIQDMFLIKYKKGEAPSVIAKNDDPGRYRNERFFKAMYGNSEAEVIKNLTIITWCPKLVNQQLPVTTINGVDKQLLKVSTELDEHPEWADYLISAGTFNWRNIAGSSMLSVHSFAIAIDLNTAYSSYWLWDYPNADENTDIGGFINQIPQGIIDIFEKHGFIWGGKWYHYDSMHFEYRPELLTE